MQRQREGARDELDVSLGDADPISQQEADPGSGERPAPTDGPLWTEELKRLQEADSPWRRTVAREDGAQKATLKRKLTGPPRLLGKTRTRSEEDGPETPTDQTGMAESNSAGSGNEHTEIDSTGLSAAEAENSRGRCEAASDDDDDITNRKVNRRRWWRRFSPAVICYRKGKKNIEGRSERQKSHVAVLPEGALQEAEATTRKTSEDVKPTEGKRRLNMRTWPKFKRFLPLSGAGPTLEQKRDDGDESLTTFREKIRKIFTRGGKTGSFRVPLEKMEDVMKCEEAASSPESLDRTPDRSLDRTPDQSLDRRVEMVMVAAEMSVQLADEPEQGPDHITDSTDVDSRSETMEAEVAEVVPAPHPLTVASPEKDVLNGNHQPSTSAASSPGDSPLHRQAKMTSESSLQPSANGPVIRIELVPPDDVDREEEEAELWEGSASSENHNHLLLTGVQHGERQLLQTARSLVRAAMNAAVAQLTREQLSGSECVLREPPGCRDHA